MQIESSATRTTTTFSSLNARPAQAACEDREDLLDSWKEIASFFGRDVRTVQMWEKREGLPIHRHFHVQRASVHAYRAELQAWQRSRRTGKAASAVVAISSEQASAA